MNILVSACLMGVKVRYDGGGALNGEVAALMERHHLIPVCAEVFGGLPTPRIPAERVCGRVLTRDGRDVTEMYARGAEEIARLAELYGCSWAILKEHSPSCGCGRIYDGSFTGTLTEGNGVLAERLMGMGVHVAGESQVKRLIEDGIL